MLTTSATAAAAAASVSSVPLLCFLRQALRFLFGVLDLHFSSGKRLLKFVDGEKVDAHAGQLQLLPEERVRLFLIVFFFCGFVFVLGVRTKKKRVAQVGCTAGRQQEGGEIKSKTNRLNILRILLAIYWYAIRVYWYAIRQYVSTDTQYVSTGTYYVSTDI